MNIPRILLFDILNGTSSLDTSNGKSGGISKAGDDPGLPFERALQGFVDLVRSLQVDDVKPSFSSADDKKLVLDGHGVNTILNRQSRSWLLLSQIPVLDSLVPRSSDEHGLATNVDSLDTANGLVVGSYLLGCCATSSEVKHSCCFVCASSENFGSIL